MAPSTWRGSACVCALAVVLLAVAPVSGQMVPNRDSLMAEKDFSHSDLYIGALWAPANEIAIARQGKVNQDLAKLGVLPTNAHLDHRTGRWGTLIPTQPLIPGDGIGNDLAWPEAAPASGPELKAAVWTAFKGYLDANEAILKISTDELAQPARMGVSGDLIQIWAPRVIDGVPVRDTYLSAAINKGNLILFGARNWGDLDVSVVPTLTFDEAFAKAEQHLAGVSTFGQKSKPSLMLVPVSKGNFLPEIPVGAGLGYRLAWAVYPDVGSHENYEALVDAHNGELLSFLDSNHYQTARTITGGVLPVSNDGQAPDGVEQADWPMPYADILLQGEPSGLFTDAGGNAPVCVDGAIGTTLAGRYMAMNDNCGPIEEFAPGDLNLGTNSGTDCSTPADADSPGNTRSSRSGFFEMTMIIDQAQGYLPDNLWVFDQLTSNMNIVSNCNAFWDGSTVNFFTSGGGCGNTGELAGVFDHEWGHGMDNNGVNPNIASPGEGIPDIYAGLRLFDSCIGRGFLGGNCSGYGNACLDCSGVRDIDWADHVLNDPIGIEEAFSQCTFQAGGGPCGRVVHCEGQLYSQSVWDMATRTLQGAPFNMDENTAFEKTTRLAYLGANNVGEWYNCDQFAETGDGCNADGGYFNFLAADDDNGSLADGTPRMGAIFAAFNSHDIACSTPTPQNSGCSQPSAAPNVTITAIDRGAKLEWTSVPGATRYQVFRTDGVFGCSFGKALIGETSDLEYVDIDGLLNGREYWYAVAAVGAADSCVGPLSTCQSLVPQDGPNLTIDGSSNVLTIATGDGDDTLDNCEMATMDFDVFSVGTGAVSNVTILDARSPSHPIDITSSFPIVIAPNLASCASATGSIDFTANGLQFDDTLEIEVDVTADELNGVVRTATFTVAATESDFAFTPSKTFSFENDAEGWTVQMGTFDRTDDGGGGNGTDFYMASSAFLEFQCDQVTSPVMKLAADSTLSVWNNFDIEPTFGGGVWYDRANFGLLEDGGARTSLDPDGGRGHDATGANGTCDTEGQDGFAGAQTSWAESSYSATALNAGDFAGDPVRLSVYYGTDPLEHGYGFWFDEVTVTNVELQEADAQPNDCGLVAPDVTLIGSCPGDQTVRISGLTPGGTVVVGIGTGTDGTVIPNGQCAGTMVDLSGVRARQTVTADGDGRVQFMQTPGANACDDFIQALDVTSCATSPAVPVQ